jgi:hypothetical protein
LGEFVKIGDPLLEQQSTFARLLIGHREGTLDLRAPPTEPGSLIEPSPDLLPFRLQRASRETCARLHTYLARDSYSTPLAWNDAFEIKCGPKLLVVLLHEAFPKGDLARLAVQRPLIAGLVASWVQEDRSYVVSRVILAGPLHSQEVYINIYRTDGLLVHAGNGRGADFAIRSRKIEGNIVVDIGGRLQGNQVELSRARAAVRVEASRAPAPFVPPP